MTRSIGQMRRSLPLTPNLYLIASLIRRTNRFLTVLMVSDKAAILVGVLAVWVFRRLIGE
jgi:hypothetical protein